jgi:predicted phage terminase large subunit-like protein
VAPLIDWWLDDLGFPRPERAGVVRWFVRGEDNVVHWADSPGELRDRFPESEPKSFTFVPAKLDDNKVLAAADPGYKANLLALPHWDRMRLLYGNWRTPAEEGEWPPAYFQPSVWFDHWLEDSEYPVTVIGFDPSRGRESKAGDYAAYVVARLDRERVVWCDAVLVREDIPRLVARGVELARSYPQGSMVCEVNIGQELLVREFERVQAKTGVLFPVAGYENRVNKQVRIRRLGPYLARGRIRFRATPGGKLLAAQLQQFPNGEHDDGPDALEMAVRRLEEIVNGTRGRK